MNYTNTVFLSIVSLLSCFGVQSALGRRPYMRPAVRFTDQEKRTLKTMVHDYRQAQQEPLAGEAQMGAEAPEGMDPSMMASVMPTPSMRTPLAPKVQALKESLRQVRQNWSRETVGERLESQGFEPEAVIAELAAGKLRWTADRLKEIMDLMRTIKRASVRDQADRFLQETYGFSIADAANLLTAIRSELHRRGSYGHTGGMPGAAERVIAEHQDEGTLEPWVTR